MTLIGLPGIAARFAVALRAAGVAAGPDRAARFAAAVTVTAPVSRAELRACAHATLVSTLAERDVLDRVFDAVFGGLVDPAENRGDPNAPDPIAATSRHPDPTDGTSHAVAAPIPGRSFASATPGGDERDDDAREVDVPSAATDAERLHHREFSELTVDELIQLAAAMARLRLVTPPRRTRRTRRATRGRVDIRATLRDAHRTGGDPVELRRRRRRERPRRLVALCDISGSMEPYARAMLQMLWCAAGAASAEAFVFATRLTRLTADLSRVPPGVALARATERAPDWSGGTRIAAALGEFIDRHGRRGMARGAVVLVISDGWETGDPAHLGREMARLGRLAYRVVWVNPRTQSARYRPLVGGMAAAWPHCDAVVSAHRLDVLDELVAELGRSRRAVR